MKLFKRKSQNQVSLPGYHGPGRYQHYKGGEYEVIGIAVVEASVPKELDHKAGQSKSVREDYYRLAQADKVVIYRPLTPGSMLDGTTIEFWSRPLEDFNQAVTIPGGWDQADRVEFRFVRVK